jgi:adenylyl- and sulfurtransferase ThiI
MFKPNCLILILAPEICLKSKQVRIFYEKFLKKNIIEYLKFDEVEYSQILVRSGRMYIFSKEASKVRDSIKNCFGIYKFMLAEEKEITGLEELIKLGCEIGVEKLEGTFAVRAKSYDKNIRSKKIEELLGGEILKHKPELKVDLSKPKTQLNCILIKNKVYFYYEESFGSKGMPIGTQGVVALIGKDKVALKKIAVGLLKTGCRVLTVDSELVGLAKYNNRLEIKDVSLAEAKDSYSLGRVRAFFCDAKTLYEKEKIEKEIETKPFSPLFSIAEINID